MIRKIKKPDFVPINYLEFIIMINILKYYYDQEHLL